MVSYSSQMRHEFLSRLSDPNSYRHYSPFVISSRVRSGVYTSSDQVYRQCTTENDLKSSELEVLGRPI